MAWIERRRAGYFVAWRDPVSHAIQRQWFRKGQYELARERKSDIERELRRDEYVPLAVRKTPMEEYLGGLIEADTELRPSSRDTYASTIKTHIRGTWFGQTPIGRVSPELIRRFWTEQARLGSGARRGLYQVLAKALNQAVRDGIFAVSPLRRSGVKQPTKERQREVRMVTADDIEALAEAATASRDRVCILLAGYAGLRAGEVGGLREQDVDFLKSRISIQQATHRNRHGREVGAVKTKSSRRTISVPPSLIQEISVHVAANPPAPDGRILYTRGFGYLTDITLNKLIHDLAKNIGIAPVNFHALRHATAALLIAQGAQPKQIQSYLGHSSIRITFDVYGNLFDAAGEDLAATLETIRAAVNTKARVIPLSR